ncbi:tetratricopeptide repeat protein [Bdellovibrio sp. PAP01]|uniref:Tetratricopeptide repeat protein n=2 Tax=Bdellovibrio svalbardensis TaxID=2972972 RepID=A0ABT6DGW8_9BACT|nr:tetratricopeptide repeat protein [Bdellovibrio svalbardensis]
MGSIVACSSFQIDRSDESAVAAKNLAEENEINNAERLLALARFEEARAQFKSFQGTYPQSFYFQSSRLGEAESLEGLGKWSEAVTIDRDVYEKTLKHQPAIAARALYRMSFAYEALGDDLKTLATLLDAYRMGSQLPSEVANAEIPARLASVYGKAGRDKEAMEYLNLAEKGIAKVREEKRDLDQTWLAKTYVQMGTVSTNQVSSENFEAAVEGQKMVQVYLIKAMQMNDPIWSQRGVDQAKNTYLVFLTLLQAQHGNRQLEANMGGSLSDLIEQAELFKPLQGQKVNSFEKDFFSYLQEVRKKIEDILYQTKETMSLTEESQRMNSVKRPGRAKVDALLPEEEKRPIQTPPKIVPTEDPNL